MLDFVSSLQVTELALALALALELLEPALDFVLALVLAPVLAVPLQRYAVASELDSGAAGQLVEAD